MQWSLDLSLLQQWGLPAGGSPALQFLTTLSLNYDLFHDDTIGDGSIQFSTNLAAYPTARNGAEIGSNLGVISAINDWPVSQHELQQLTYTQAFPGDRLSVSVGQFPFSNFDGNEYFNDQQQSFVNYVFSQNGSSTYATAGLGAYAQFSPRTDLHFVLGSQFPNDGLRESLSSSGFGFNDRAWLAYAQWTPDIVGLGSSQYSLTYLELDLLRWVAGHARYPTYPRPGPRFRTRPRVGPVPTHDAGVLAGVSCVILMVALIGSTFLCA